MAATNFDAQRKIAAGLPGATEDIRPRQGSVRWADRPMYPSDEGLS
jgi:hypothetical protein